MCRWLAAGDGCRAPLHLCLPLSAGSLHWRSASCLLLYASPPIQFNPIQCLCREFKGPVTAVEGLEGYLLLASGNRIESCALTRCRLLAWPALPLLHHLQLACCLGALPCLRCQQLIWASSQLFHASCSCSLLQHHGDQHWRGWQPQRRDHLEAAALRCVRASCVIMC